VREVHKWKSQYLEKLEKLVKDDERATLAELRRSLGKNPTVTLVRIGWLFAGVPDFALDTAVLHAGLFAIDGDNASSNNFGKAFRVLLDSTGSDSIEKRFVSLVETEREDLATPLRHAIKLLASKEIGLDWAQLFDDLLGWHYESRGVQRKWARSFWSETFIESVDKTVIEPQTQGAF
jgi:CRISPR system Cascade subunit CasB